MGVEHVTLRPRTVASGDDTDDEGADVAVAVAAAACRRALMVPAHIAHAFVEEVGGEDVDVAGNADVLEAPVQVPRGGHRLVERVHDVRVLVAAVGAWRS